MEVEDFFSDQFFFLPDAKIAVMGEKRRKRGEKRRKRGKMEQVGRT